MRGTRPTVAAIVAAYNEEPTIGPIVHTLVNSHAFRDVIVVSDGSTDRTAQVAREHGASLVHEFTVNQGKGAAMRAGVQKTDADILFFCDADLIGLTEKHVHLLLDPVLNGSKAMNIGLWDRGHMMMNIVGHLPLISGQRCMRRSVFEKVPEQFLQGYMVETALNYSCRRQKLPYGVVPLPGLHIRHKMQKIGVLRGFFAYLRMTAQVIRSMILVRL
jgi:glycosyltransferase involved in cell wall biosynthesis